MGEFHLGAAGCAPGVGEREPQDILDRAGARGAAVLQPGEQGHEDPGRAVGHVWFAVLAPAFHQRHEFAGPGVVDGVRAGQQQRSQSGEDGLGHGVQHVAVLGGERGEPGVGRTGELRVPAVERGGAAHEPGDAAHVVEGDVVARGDGGGVAVRADAAEPAHVEAVRSLGGDREVPHHVGDGETPGAGGGAGQRVAAEHAVRGQPAGCGGDPADALLDEELVVALVPFAGGADPAQRVVDR